MFKRVIFLSEVLGVAGVEGRWQRVERRGREEPLRATGRRQELMTGNRPPLAGHRGSLPGVGDTAPSIPERFPQTHCHSTLGSPC